MNRIGPAIELSNFQLNILYAIERLDYPNGYEIREKLDEHYESVHTSRLYRNTKVLQEEGLINKEKANDGQRNRYSLTERGKNQIESDRRWRNRVGE